MKLDLQEMELEDADWIYVSHHSDPWLALVNTVMNLLVPQKVGNFLNN
jgi:hypothetical protein